MSVSSLIVSLFVTRVHRTARRLMIRGSPVITRVNWAALLLSIGGSPVITGVHWVALLVAIGRPPTAVGGRRTAILTLMFMRRSIFVGTGLNTFFTFPLRSLIAIRRHGTALLTFTR